MENSILKKLLKSSVATNPTQSFNQLSTVLQANISGIRTDFGASSDLVIRQFQLGQGIGRSCALIYIEGLADPQVMLEGLLLHWNSSDHSVDITSAEHPIQVLREKAIALGEISETQDMITLYNSVLSGDSVLLIDGDSVGLVLGTRKWKERSVEEPNAQTVVRGPRDGFTETLRTNVALVRRRIKSNRLRFESIQLGTVTQTDVCIAYIDGIVNETVLQEVRSRLGRIQIDAILESGYIEEFIQESTYSPFPTVYNTERPDGLSAGLLEGRVAILIDGTPFSLLVPALFNHYFQASEDYYQRADFATLLRFLRFLCFFISLLAPSLYIAVTTFHQELMPPELLIRLVAAREGVPFPAFVEAVLMELTFEILREAGVRMPRAIGQAVSIVGTLVIGQAAVEAGIVSPSMVIVVALTAISNFVIPSFNMGISLRILRFVIMLLAASFGLFGITVALLAIILHLCHLRSFTIPYMSPFAPLNLQDQRDALFRVPHWAMGKKHQSLFHRKKGNDEA
jgi:spore germination protein KA